MKQVNQILNYIKKCPGFRLFGTPVEYLNEGSNFFTNRCQYSLRNVIGYGMVSIVNKIYTQSTMVTVKGLIGCKK